MKIIEKIDSVFAFANTANMRVAHIRLKTEAYDVFEEQLVKSLPPDTDVDIRKYKGATVSHGNLIEELAVDLVYNTPAETKPEDTDPENA